jgi:hypothetical protein
MKPLPSFGTLSDAGLHRVEADVQAKIGALFTRCPTLCGFAVQDRSQLPEKVEGSIPDADLYVTEIGIYPKLSAEQYGEIFDEITVAISDLVYEQPKAYDVLRGRTFARTLQ